MTAPDGGTLARAKVEVILELRDAEKLEERIKRIAKSSEKALKKSFASAERSADKNARGIARAFERAAARAEAALAGLSGKDVTVRVHVEDDDGNPIGGAGGGGGNRGGVLGDLDRQIRDLEKTRKAALEFDVDFDVSHLNAKLAHLRTELLKAQAKAGGIDIPVHLEGKQFQASIAAFDKEQAKRLLDGLNAEIKRLETGRTAAIELEPRLDTKALDAQIAELRARLLRARAGEAGITIPVDIDRSRLDRALLALEKRLPAIRERLDKVGDGLRKIGSVGLASLGGLTRGLLKFEAVFAKVTGIATLVVGAIGLVGGALAGLLNTLPPLIGAIGLLSGALGVLPAGLALIGTSVATLVIGFQGLGDAIKGIKAAKLSGDTKKLDEALKKLSPSARATVQEFLRLGPVLGRLRLRVQEELFRGLGDEVRRISGRLLPALSDGFAGLARQFNQAAKIFGEGLISRKSLADTASIFTSFRTTLRALLPAIDPLRRALTDVVTVGARQLPSLADSLTKVSQRIADTIARARASGALDDFFKRGIDAAKQLGRILGNVGGIIGGIFKASAGAGAGFLNSLERITGTFEDFVKSTQGQTDLRSFFASLSKAASAFAPVLKALVDVIGKQLAPSFAAIATAIGPGLVAVIRSIGDIVTAATPGLVAFSDALSKAFSDPAIQASLKEIGRLLGEAFADVGTQAAPLIKAFADILKAALPLVGPLANLATIIAQVLARLATVIAPTLPGIIDTLGRAVQAITPGLITFVDAALKALADPALANALITLFSELSRLLAELAPFVGPLIHLFADLVTVLLKITDVLGPLPTLLFAVAVAMGNGPLGLAFAAFALGGAIANATIKLDNFLGGIRFGNGDLLKFKGGILDVNSTFQAFQIEAVKARIRALEFFGKPVPKVLQDELDRLEGKIKDVPKAFEDARSQIGKTAAAFGGIGAEAGSKFQAGLRAALSNIDLSVTVNVRENRLLTTRGLRAGGVVESPTLAALAEDGRREVVLPLTNADRMRQLLADPRVAGPVNAALNPAPQAATGPTFHQNFTVNTPRVDMPALAAMVSARLLAGVR